MALKILKIFALCSALALGGGYVWWSQKNAEEKRAQAEDRSRAVTLPGSKSAVIAEDAGFETSREEIDRILEKPPEKPLEEVDKERMVLPGSKSGFVRPVPAEEKPKQRTVLPGSKSLSGVIQAPEKESSTPP